MSSRHVVRHGQSLIANNFTKYAHILTNNMLFSSVWRALSNGILHGSPVVACKKIGTGK